MRLRLITQRVLLLLGILLMVAILITLVAFGVNRPLRYELSPGLRGWVVIQYEDPDCQLLETKGIYLVIPIPASAHVCTSNSLPMGWRYTRYEYLNPDGTWTQIPSSTWIKDRQIWAGISIPAGPGVRFPRSAFFVGTQTELEKSWATRPTLRDPP